MSTRLVVIAIAIAMSACSEDKKETKGTPQVPEVLAFSKPSPGRQLTKDQVKEIEEAFSNKETMMLPPGHLIFKPKDMSAAEHERKSSELLLQDRNSYAFLKAINANCNKGRATSSIEASFPTNGDMQIENLRTNDRASVGSQVRISDRSGCPVDVDGQFSMNAKIEEIDQSANKATVSAGMGYGIKLISLDPKYSQLLGKRGLILQTSISGLGTVADTQGRAMLSFNLNGSYLSLNEEIPVSMSVQVLNRLKKVEGSKEREYADDGKQVISITIIKMKTFEARIDSHQLFDAKGILTAEEVYVNGHLMAAADVRKIFGKDNPATSAKSNTVIQVLN